MSKKGFTIIELVVVIAIIAILASIVLISVSGYMNKAKDSAIKANLSTAQTTATVYLSDKSTSSGLCTMATDFVKAYNAAVALKPSTTLPNRALCNESTTDGAWRAFVELNNTKECGTWGGFFCVDSTGYKKITCNTPHLPPTYNYTYCE